MPQSTPEVRFVANGLIVGTMRSEKKAARHRRAQTLANRLKTIVRIETWQTAEVVFPAED